MEAATNQVVCLVERVENGGETPLSALAQLRQLKDVIDASIKQIEEWAIDELYKYEGKTATLYGVKMELRNSAGRWDYSGLPYYEEAKAKLKHAEELGKMAYNAKTKTGSSPIDPTTGELIEAAQYTPGKETIFVTLAR